MPLLGEANAVLLGSTPVDAIYARDAKVWPMVSGPPDGVGVPWNVKGQLGNPPLYNWKPALYDARWNGDFVEVELLAWEGQAYSWAAFNYVTWPAANSPSPNAQPLPLATGFMRKNYMEITGGLANEWSVFHDHDIFWQDVANGGSESGRIHQGGFTAFYKPAGDTEFQNFILEDWGDKQLTYGGVPPPLVGTTVAPGQWYFSVRLSSDQNAMPPLGTIRLDVSRTQYHFINVA